ncbi:MAG: ATP-binding cassette domain-containing protein [Firmicutes bacterium]|nr:ATP-binding cassette domain-containing protein [Bacillota bacterium]
MLELKNVSISFSKGTADEHRAIGRLSLRVDEGEFVTIIGANGAGKSTLFNLICGSLIPDEGSVFIDGRNVTMDPEHRRAAYIGRIFRDPMRGSAPGLTIEENLSLAAGTGKWMSLGSRQDHKRFRDALAQLGMGLEDRMTQPVGLLSGGQRQAVTLMMAVINPPKLLLLDEHTAALDPGSAEKVLDITKQAVALDRLTCLMITHDMGAALRLGSRTLMMDQGRVIYDVEGEERSGLSTQDLLRKFRETSGRELESDRMLLSAGRKP